MNQKFQFDKELLRFMNMAIQIWPSFKSGLKHLQQVSIPKQGSYLPAKAYNHMSQAQFRKVIVDDFFEFIMTHDVKEEDLCDYLHDILDLLMMEQDFIGGSNNPASIQSTSKYMYRVLEQLQNGKNQLVVKFQEEIYQNVKQFSQQINEDQNNSSDSQDSNSEDYSSNQDYDNQEEPNLIKPEKIQEQKKIQEQLQDDGWIIVKKK